jgi:hypothetical protein
MMRALLAGLLLMACAGPYSGTPDRLWIPKAKAGTTMAGPASQSSIDDGPCTGNFDGDPISMGRRNQKAAKSLERQASNDIDQANGAAIATKSAKVVEALGYLKDALRNDPYDPKSTYDMAAAYALVGRKKCVMKLIQRLSDLANVPDPQVQADVASLKTKAKKDDAFDLLRKDVDGALQ